MSSIIKIKDLEFGWPTPSSYKLSIKELSISKGERVFIQGPSGCGKSTLLSLLTGVNLTNKGELSLFDTELSSLSGSQRDQFRADHIGVIFQQFNLIPYLTTIENVVLACAFSPARKKSALEKSSSIEEEAKRLLSHLEIVDDELLHKQVSQLSVGQQQRVAAARALIGSPDIIIADEPTSSLDADRCDSFMNLLSQEVESCGASLLFVSHDQRLQAHFDRVLSLSIDKVANIASLTSLTDAKEQQ